MTGIKGKPKAVYVIKNGSLQGVILDCAALVEEHSYADSPVAIGQLLNNTAKLYFMANEEQPAVRTQTGKGRSWVELRNASKHLIARVPAERPFPVAAFVTRERLAQTALRRAS